MISDKLKLNRLVLLAVAFFLSGLAGYYSLPKCGSSVPISEGGQIIYKVAEVVDGDTIKIEMNGRTETVRLIGINSPEVSGLYRQEECFGPEASQRAKTLLAGGQVYLLSDPSTSDKDKYGRLLRYVFLPGGDMINADLVRDGFAFNYIYEPFQYMKQFGELEKQAKERKAGLWGEKCDYQ